MRVKLMLFVIAISLTMLVAPTALACENCIEAFVWPQLEWCPYCTPARCGATTCELLQGDWCSVRGEGCNEGGNGCPDVYTNPPPSYPIAQVTIPVSPSWRLTRTRVDRPTRNDVGRSDRRPRGSRG